MFGARGGKDMLVQLMQPPTVPVGSMRPTGTARTVLQPDLRLRQLCKVCEGDLCGVLQRRAGGPGRRLL